MLRSLRGGLDGAEETVALVIRPTIWRDTRGLGMVYNFPLGGLLIVTERPGAMKVREG